jgi:hypothetical protein
MLQPISTDTVTQTSPLASDVPITVDVDWDPASKLMSIPPDVTFRADVGSARQLESIPVQLDTTSYLKEVIVLLDEEI